MCISQSGSEHRFFHCSALSMAVVILLFVCKFLLLHARAKTLCPYTFSCTHSTYLHTSVIAALSSKYFRVLVLKPNHILFY